MATHPDSPAVSLLRETPFPARARRKSTKLAHKPLTERVFLHPIDRRRGIFSEILPESREFGAAGMAGCCVGSLAADSLGA
jgi:hypothetical protein